VYSFMGQLHVCYCSQKVQKFKSTVMVQSWLVLNLVWRVTIWSPAIAIERRLKQLDVRPLNQIKLMVKEKKIKNVYGCIIFSNETHVQALIKGRLGLTPTTNTLELMKPYILWSLKSQIYICSGRQVRFHASNYL
jgi:hypothetical protein